jgi:hypothetical protein
MEGEFRVMEDWNLRQQDLAMQMAERERQARSRRRSFLCARMVRGLFTLAVAAERGDAARGLGGAGRQRVLDRMTPMLQDYPNTG